MVQDADFKGKKGRKIGCGRNAQTGVEMRDGDVCD